MKFITALEVIFWMAVLYALVRQIIVPLWNGEKLFPLLRKRRDLEVKLRDVRTEMGNRELLRRISEEKLKLSSEEDAPTITPKSKAKSSTSK